MPLVHTSPLILSALLLFAPVAASAQVSPALQRATVATTPMAANTPVTGTVWLTVPAQAALEQAIAAMYAPGSPTYHKFLTWQTLAPYLPTADQLKAVQTGLTANNLTVTRLDPYNLSIDFQGQAGNVEAALHTNIESHTLANGKQVQAFTAAPVLENSAAGLVQAITIVGGTDEEPAIMQPTDPVTGKLLGVKSMAQAAAQATTTGTPYCILSPAPVVLTTPGQTLPAAAYAGPIYGTPLTGGKLTPTGMCDYTPAQFDSQTGLDTIHAAGYTGAGQSIAILEEVGSTTLASDVAAFDKLYNLPAADLQIVNLTTGSQTDTAFKETTLDVESAHVVAPGAKLVVVDVNPGALQEGLRYVMENKLANVVSISYGSMELQDTVGDITTWNEELMTASSMGITVDVCSQDYGDLVADEGEPDVDVPADSPYATGVGGLSIAYVPGTTQLYKTSWGTNLTVIGANGVPLATPQPVRHGTDKFGGGGGVSRVFPVPSYQTVLGGTGRHVPDVSDLADGYTGLNIVVTDPTVCTTNPCVESAGGTSLATPIFSGKWALLNQLFGSSLGQAAPLIAQYANTPAVEDIVPLPEAAVVGATLSSSGPQLFSANALASPETSQPFVSALWQSDAALAPGALSGDDYVISFGTDSSLAVTPGYDSATGWGQLDISAIFSALTGSAAGH